MKVDSLQSLDPRHVSTKDLYGRNTTITLSGVEDLHGNPTEEPVTNKAMLVNHRSSPPAMEGEETPALRRLIHAEEFEPGAHLLLEIESMINKAVEKWMVERDGIVDRIECCFPSYCSDHWVLQLIWSLTRYQQEKYLQCLVGYAM